MGGPGFYLSGLKPRVSGGLRRKWKAGVALCQQEARGTMQKWPGTGMMRAPVMAPSLLQFPCVPARPEGVEGGDSTGDSVSGGFQQVGK